MKKLNILFRTAGGQTREKQLGLGHVFRCIHLAYFLKPNKIFFLLEDYGEAKKVFYTNGYTNIFTIPKGISLDSDIRKTCDFIIKNNIDIIIIDKYNVQNQYVNTIQQLTKTVVISDLWEINYNADLITNGFIGFKNCKIINKFGTPCLVGPKYQILNRQYMQHRNKILKKYDLLLTFGGYDTNNLIEKFLNILLKHDNYKIKTKIILGPATIKTKKIKEIERNYNKCLEIFKETTNMKKEILSTKFGICGGGITTYEFATMKVPFAIICQYKHQLITAKEWEKKGIAQNLGLPSNNLNQKLKTLLRKITKNKIYTKRKNLVDGMGSKRVAQEILKLCK